MKRKKVFARVLAHPGFHFAGVLAIVLAAAEVFIDWTTWIQLNISIVYSLPLVLAAATRNRRLIWGLMLVLISMTFAVYYQQIPAGVFGLHEPFFVNRVLAALALVITAALLHGWTLAIDAIEVQRRALKEQNEQLELAQEEIKVKNKELERRRGEAEEASRRKTQLLASVSHDIRTPVNAINLLAQVIQRRLEKSGLSSEVLGLAEDLHISAVSLVRLLTEVLDLSSFDSGQVSLKETDFSVNDLLFEECRRVRPLAEAKNLQLITEAPAFPLWLRTDRGKLARVLANLVSNAIKFTATGTVTVSAVLEAGAPAIQVGDTGIGIAAANLERIFDEFAQLSDPERDINKGWGLGLAICRRLLRLMGGDITVDSQPGTGSAFTIHLPASCILEGADDRHL
jgi:signal transduction histidine kinase